MTTFPTPAIALQSLVPPLYAAGGSVYQVWLDWAAERLTTAAGGWGGQYNAAIALLAGHLWYRLTGGQIGTLTDDAAQQVGGITSKGAADLSESYGALGNGTISLEEAELCTTRPGAAFSALRKTRPAFGARVQRVA